MDELKTIRDFVRWGASRFNEAGLHFGHGSDNALDEALGLVLHALHLNHSLPVSYLDSRLTAAERDAVAALLHRRIDERLPSAYLTGGAWFAGLYFQVDENVLVPRSPIAELLERGFEPWIEAEQIGRVLDLCTGSGCIAIAAAHYLPEAQVDAIDISDAALSVAAENVQRHGLEGRVNLYQGDIYEGLPDGAAYDVIVSNPPYVSHEEHQSLPAEYHREPALGLAADDEGLALVIRILQGAAERLNPGGILIVEVGNSAEALVERYPDCPFLWLAFERGGDGVFLLTEQQLRQYRF
ncbi:MAG: 50S ribosomal protein L3 N(5)-glutamine methyltransferase [Gammaproteobacteria bacterium]|nr:50S ribosomal protein L3 N(5)-glutamine methyltransferase [Gammaproteobacteria bacterium]MBU1653968.1 50S ribosomal protein L3 N(5)-glutamine methyltransferase [Gammaproteobacteria bacterium]MBU1961351.1 50S ribosomal protein L3 N(5)-glutamine methyltransferase [Gammaproteobacteria bacterium]